MKSLSNADEIGSLSGVLEAIESYSTQTVETAGHARDVADILQGLTAAGV